MQHEHDHHMVEGEHSPKEYFKFALILAGIAGISWVLNDGGWVDYMRWFMGVFFGVFAFFKFLGYDMFVMMYPGYDIVAKRFKAYAYAFPFIELTLGFMYLFNMAPTVRDIITVIVMGVGSIGVFQELKRRRGIHCACLGNIIKLPLSTVSLVEDVGMGVMALVMLIAA